MTRWLLIVLLLLPSLACAGQGLGPGPGYKTYGATGDSCTGALLFAAHMENDDDVTAGSPTGCSVGDTTIAKTGATYSSTQASDGTYSAYSTAENSSLVIASTNMDVSLVGTWCADVYYTNTVLRRVFTISATGPMGAIVYSAGANTMRSSYASENYTGSDTFPNDAWTRVCATWDATQSAGSDKLGTKVGANAWQTQTNRTLTSLGSNPATYYIGGAAFLYWPGYVDNIKLYSDYAHAE